MLARTHKVRGQKALVTQTIREFDGGWNVIDNDLNLQLKYSTELENMVRKDDGSLGIRWGTKLFVEIPVIAGNSITNMIYFQDHLIVVTMGNGTEAVIYSVAADGTTTVIWDHAIAGAKFDVWQVSTAYEVAQHIQDGGIFYNCTKDHTSGTTSITDDISTDPAIWEVISAGWIGSTFASFAAFNDHLIVCNGVDKPLRINLFDTPTCRYLVDEGTGLNGNTPVCKYVAVVNEFVCMAGDVQEPALLYISSEGTSGTYVDDPGVDNNAVNISTTKKISVNNQVINGIARYRDLLVVQFDDALLFGVLGNIIDNGEEVVAPAKQFTHEPDFSDALEAHGCIAHHSVQFLGDDLFLADLVGVASIARTAVSDTLTPSRPSELIDPAIQQAVRELSVGVALDNIFSVYNLIEKQYMVFIPNHDNNAVVTEAPEVIIVDYDESDLIINVPDHNISEGDTIQIAGCIPFNTITDPDINTDHVVHTVINPDYITIQLSAVTFDVALEQTNREADENNEPTVTALRTETLGFILNHRKTGKKVNAWSRFRGWNWTCSCRTLLGTVMFATNDRIFLYGNHQQPYYEDFIGVTEEDAIGYSQTPIKWSWELPWHDFKNRMEIKRLKYLGMDTRGDSDYTISAFIDDIYKDSLGHRDPALQMHVYGKDAGGYGAGTQPYGGGRRMEGERLFAWPTKFKLLKLRFEGESTRPLRVVSLLLALQKGDIRR